MLRAGYGLQILFLEEKKMANVVTLIGQIKDNVVFVLISLAMMAGTFIIAKLFEKLIEKKTGRRFREEKTKINRMTIMGMLSALSFILMFFEFPIPFVAPGFYKLDFSEVPVLIGAFMLGPAAGVVIEAVKILLNVVIEGTTTVFVGEFANFILGCAFVVPTAVIYGFKKNRKSAIIGMVIGGLVLIFAGSFLNAFYLLPKYAQLYGMNIQKFVDAGHTINAKITDVFTFVAIAVAPFNLIKALLVSVITGLLYKYISRLFKA